MNIYTLLSPGKYHKVYGEDFVFYQFLGNRWLIGAVMDGCSSGKDSHFASTLYAKSLHKSCRMLPNMKEILPEIDLEKMAKEDVARFILGQLFEDVKKVKKTLFLDIEEILSTIILLVYDLTDDSALVNISGDGIIACNTVLKEVDQHNMPDYLGYHCEEKFDHWYENNTESMSFTDVKDIAISTDGIGKLRNNPLETGRIVNPIELFLLDRPKIKTERSFYEMYNKLIEEDNFIPHDDIGIIRIIP